jgi:hypothetical protein
MYLPIYGYLVRSAEMSSIHYRLEVFCLFEAKTPEFVMVFTSTAALYSSEGEIPAVQFTRLQPQRA